MLKRLNYILLMILFLAIQLVAQAQSVIDKVCKDAVRTYRVDGETGLTYTWILKDHLGNSVSIPSGSPFTDTDTSGNLIEGSEITIAWSFTADTYSLSVEKQSSFSCSTDELGTIEVVPKPFVNAGLDQTVCGGTVTKLNDATASDITTSGLEWTTSGDGTFDNPNAVNPNYTPGSGDLLAGKVTLKISAKSMGDADGCLQEDEVELTIVPQSKLVITNPAEVCESTPVDLTAASITVGSIIPPTANRTYWKDSGATIPLSNPSSVITSGTYYIKLDVNGKCPDIQPVNVTVNPEPKLVITNPVAVCEPTTVDLSAPYITSGSDASLILTYWNDGSATSSLSDYKAIKSSGIYYIKGENGTKCSSINLVSVTINKQSTPQFNLNNLLCINSPAPVLPTTSVDGIIGNWSPAVVSTTSLGKTTYVFTPNTGQCALPYTIEIEITNDIVPAFAAIGPFCVGSIAPLLPSKSNNGITGTWSPNAISTAASGLTNYVFTPDAGQCSSLVMIPITVNSPITPTFALVGSVCQNSTTNPLLAKSIEGISGTWSPAFSSATTGTKIYTFTPNIGECANQATLSISVVPEVIPTFAPIGSLCKNSAPPSLPLTSANGISGIWSPATISTSSLGITNYLFTSVSGGACSNPFSMPIEVVGFNLAYTKVDLDYSTLPIGSIDLTVSGGSGSYSYSWDNGATTQDISGLAAGDYKVTVTDQVTLCSEVQTISITKLINDLILVSGFTPPLCPGSNDATAIVTPSGGKAPYKYLWNNLQTDSIVTGLIAGVYSVTVTDANGLSRGAIITIPETTVKYVIASATYVDPACFGENGKIELTFGSIGIVPNDYYTILYNGGQFKDVEISGNRATISAPPGTYNNIRVFVRGCITNSVGPITIAPSPPALALPTILTVQPDCYIPVGTIEVVTPTPVTGITYTVKGVNPVVAPVTNMTGIFPGLSTGVYDLTYTDTKGCTSTPIKTTIDAQPLTPANPIAIPISAECEKRPIQTLNASMGIAPPVAGTTIIWYDAPVAGNVVISPTLNKPESITYYAEATNGRCTSISRTPVTLTIIPTPTAPISIGNLSACESLPLVTLDARDAIDPTGKNLVWYDALVGGNVVTSPTLNALKTVTYYVEDINGVCASSPRTPVSLTIFSLPANPAAVVSVVPRCIDTSGVIEVKVPIGSNFVYNVDNGPYQSSVTFINQTPGNHAIRVKNTNTNCESGITIIKVPDIPPVPKIINLTVENCICYGDSGKLNFEFENIVDGTYVIIYLGGQFENVKVKGNKATVLAKAGTYNVLAIEANGCTSSENWNVEIKQPDQISVSAKITEIDLKSKQKGEIDLTINGGTGIYQTIWKPNPINGFAGAITEDIKNLDAGIYVVTVTDASGCYKTYIDTIPKANQPPIATDDVFIANCNLVTGDLLYTDNGNGVDSDPDGDAIAIDITPVRTPTHGTLTINPDGTFEYTALQGYTGDDSFRYIVYDIKKNSSNPATVTIHVVSDTDRDGIADDLDPDADGDGILNVDEVMAGQDWKTTDSDGDGRQNYLDIDSDNDGIVDNFEAQSTPGYIKPSGIDKDHNGIDDAYDPAQGGTSIVPVDTDGDGIPDFLDVDSDGDGVPDYIEGHDLNADGKPDFVSVGKDSDGDGMDDGFDTVVNVCSPTENVTGSNAAMQDFDGDGMKDWRDENDDDDQYLTRFEDLNMDGDFSNDDTDRDGHPEYLDYGRDCDLFIPNAFSPNDDNIHDYFQIYCINHFPNARIYIFDQLGNKLYEQKNYGNVEVWGTPERAWWDGRTTNRAATTTNGGKVAPGTYYYVLQLGNGDIKKSFVFVSY